VVIADFSRVNVVTCNEKLYLGKLMERDDITVVCEGLFSQLERVKDFLDVVDHALGNEPHNKIRKFVRMKEADDFYRYSECEGYMSMKVSDYLRYLNMHQAGGSHNKRFTFVDAEGKSHTIKMEDTVYYLTDVDMPKVLHEVEEQYWWTFKIQEILPAGAWCMMNHVRIHGVVNEMAMKCAIDN